MACGDSMVSDTAHAIACDVMGTPEVIDFLMRKSASLTASRTWLVKRAIELGATHLYFVDSDVVPPIGTIKRLLSHKKAIVAGVYNKRKFPIEPTYAPLEEGGESETELYKAKHVGTGCMMIDLSIFKEIKDKWFNFGVNAEDDIVIGEDAWFCYVARDAGFDTWIDPIIKVRHMGLYPY